MKHNISFVIPCFNCEKQIIQNIKKLKNKIKSSRINFEFVMIDDGSEDGTFNKLNYLKKKFRFIKIFKNRENIGKSFSLIKGVNRSKFKNIITIDCDLPYLNSLNKVIKGLKRNNDLVIINRKIKGSKMVGFNLRPYQILRYLIGSFIAYLNIKLLKINVHGGDTQAGLKGFKKTKDFNKIKFISKKFFFDLELVLIYTRKKLKVLSVKTDYSISMNSAISLFNFSKNFVILYEYINVVSYYLRGHNK